MTPILIVCWLGVEKMSFIYCDANTYGNKSSVALFSMVQGFNQNFFMFITCISCDVLNIGTVNKTMYTFTVCLLFINFLTLCWSSAIRLHLKQPKLKNSNNYSYETLYFEQQVRQYMKISVSLTVHSIVTGRRQ